MKIERPLNLAQGPIEELVRIRDLELASILNKNKITDGDSEKSRF